MEGTDGQRKYWSYPSSLFPSLFLPYQQDVCAASVDISWVRLLLTTPTVTMLVSPKFLPVSLQVSLQLLLPFAVLFPHNSQSDLFFFFPKFIYFWLLWVFIAAHKLSLVVASGGGYSLVVMCRLFVAVHSFVVKHRL